MRRGAAVLADAGRALLEARQYSPAKELLEIASSSDPSSGLELDLSIAVFHTAGAAEGFRQIDRVAQSRRNGDYYLARAQMLDASGKSADAIAAMDQAIKASPKRFRLVYWQAAVILSRNQRNEQAFQLLDVPRNPAAGPSNSARQSYSAGTGGTIRRGRASPR